jgi:hypothetical protein
MLFPFAYPGRVHLLFWGGILFFTPSRPKWIISCADGDVEAGFSVVLIFCAAA